MSRRLSGAWHSSLLGWAGLGTAFTCQGLRKSLLLQGLPSAFGQCSTFSCNICWHKYANTELKMGKKPLFLPCWCLSTSVSLVYFLLNVKGERRGGSGASSALLQEKPQPSQQCGTWRRERGKTCPLVPWWVWNAEMNIDTQPCNSCSACWLLLPDVFQAGCCWVGWQGGGKQWSHTGCRCCSEIQKTTVIQLFRAGFQSQHCRACSNFSLYISQALLWHSSC